MRKDTVENIIKIIKCLERAEGGWLWYRECARRTGLHHKTVSRLVSKHLNMFVEEQAFEPFNVRMIRLKPDANVNNMLKFLVVKEKLDKNE